MIPMAREDSVRGKNRGTGELRTCVDGVWLCLEELFGGHKAEKCLGPDRVDVDDKDDYRDEDGSYLEGVN